MRGRRKRPSLLDTALSRKRPAPSRRRGAHRPRQGNRWLWVLLFAVACVVAFLGTYAYMQPALASWLVVRNVVISGLHEVERQDILDRLALSSTPPILSLDFEELTERVKAHPWVATATVGRVLPDTVMIEIIERVPAARLHHKATTMVLDQEGMPLPDPATFPVRRLPILKGIEPHSVNQGHASDRLVLQQGIQVAKHLAGRFAGVPHVDVRDPSQIVGEVAGYRFLFGAAIDQQWTQFMMLEASINADLKTENREIDLRFPGKIIIRERR